jgi:hypothetical protein
MEEAKGGQASPIGLLQRLNEGLEQRNGRDVLELVAFVTVTYEDERPDGQMRLMRAPLSCRIVQGGGAVAAIC